MPRSALLAACSMLLLTDASPPPPPIAAAAAAPQDRGSPVRCHRDEERRAEYYNPSPAMPAVVPAPAPVPPPPPPPQPVFAPTVADQGLVVTGIRQQLANSVAVKRSAVQAINTRSAPPAGYAAPYGSAENTERYDGKEVAAIQQAAAQPVSTFSVDVDTGAYSNIRRMLGEHRAVPPEAVRTEEMINYFRYDYPRPDSETEPFSVTADVSQTPWNAGTRLMRIGLRGYDVATRGRPPANLVFLVDVSGSMDEPDKLPLVKQALSLLADRLTPQDRVSIVVYAGNAGVVLEPTSDAGYVKAALACLDAGGSTAGGEGIEMAYKMARAHYLKGGINRIFLATDGDFNVGVSDNKALEEMVKKEREDGITLTTLGFGEGNYNEAMMERIADIGNGNYAYIDSPMEARKVLDDELSATLYTIAKDVKIQVEFNPAQVKQYRLIGYENRALAEEDFNNDAVDAGDIGAGHQVTALYEVVPADSPGWLPERRYDANRVAMPADQRGHELAYVKLRYKLPGETASRLITRPVDAGLMQSAQAPSGDMAFVTAVAAFGQKLRGDKYLMGFSYPQIASLAGAQSDYWRSEFGRLVRLANEQSPQTPGRD